MSYVQRKGAVSPARAVTLYRSGLSLREIAREMQCTPQRVARILAHMGEPRRKAARRPAPAPAPVRLTDAQATLALGAAISRHHPGMFG